MELPAQLMATASHVFVPNSTREQFAKLFRIHA